MRTETNHDKKGNGQWVSPADVERIQEKAVVIARDAYAKLVDVGSESLAEANRRAAIFIRRYPVQSACGALAVGLYLGLRLRRRA